MYGGHLFWHIFLIDVWIHFSRPLVSFWLPFGALWFPLVPFRCPLALFWLPLGSLRFVFGSLQLTFCSLWVPFRSTWLLRAPFRFVLGSSWPILVAPLDPVGVQMAAKMQPKPPKRYQKGRSGLLRRAPFALSISGPTVPACMGERPSHVDLRALRSSLIGLRLLISSPLHGLPLHPTSSSSFQIPAPFFWLLGFSFQNDCRSGTLVWRAIKGRLYWIVLASMCMAGGRRPLQITQS